MPLCVGLGISGWTDDRFAKGTGRLSLEGRLLETVRALADVTRDPLMLRREPSMLIEPLTERELAVLRYLPGALTNADIAAQMGVSVHTVKTHVRNIFRKLGVSCRRNAVLRGRELGLL
jgi:ATP/maltotriose-dependent transcriptional regulator MalT